MRSSTITRSTNETQIELSLSLDGIGSYNNDTGCGFLNHMLDLFAKHSRFNLSVKCKGDTDVDFHHTTEDIGIVLGKAFRECLQDMRGVLRYGSIILPMDEVLMLCAVDICSRATYVSDAVFSSSKIGDFDTELINEFMLSFVRSANITLHFKQLNAGNNHHTAEAMFKALARALSMAVTIDEAHKDELASTKGVI